VNDDEDHDRWPDREPVTRGPSAPPTLRFDPLATGLGVFAAVAIPVFVIGYTRSAGANTTIIVIGIAAGVVLGIIAGMWVAHRGGRVWRGPQL
jgi:hypothetical protein